MPQPESCIYAMLWGKCDVHYNEQSPDGKVQQCNEALAEEYSVRVWIRTQICHNDRGHFGTFKLDMFFKGQL